MKQEIHSRYSTNQAKTLNDEIDDSVRRWLSRFPVDIWWRKRHGVAFGSSQHRETSLFDELREYREELRLRSRDDLGVGRDDRVLQLTQDEIDADYENIDLDDF